MSSLYELPLAMHEEGLDTVVGEVLGLEVGQPDLTEWEAVVARGEAAVTPMRIGIVGKYVSLVDAYLSVVEALNHASAFSGVKPTIDWIQAEDAEGLLAEGRLHDLDGIIIPGGFGPRGVEGKVAAAGWAREHGVPCLGLCLGMQVMTVEYARNAPVSYTHLDVYKRQPGNWPSSLRGRAATTRCLPSQPSA